MQPDRERLVWHLARVDAWIQNADTKATILLALAGAIIAAVVAVNANKPEPQVWYVVAGGMVVNVLACASVLSSLLAVLPTLRSPPDDTSLYHFSDVAKWRLEEFRSRYRDMSPDDDLANLSQQVHTNSKIAHRKFVWLRRSTMLAWGSAALLLLWIAAVVWTGHHIQVPAAHHSGGTKRA
ncbi:MAG: DUF5706 domain-containing protein [Firmicutes bacterium]|nr:DUF5706 domain-containing protein [Bacillota bacterium]